MSPARQTLDMLMHVIRSDASSTEAFGRLAARLIVKGAERARGMSPPAALVSAFHQTTVCSQGDPDDRAIFLGALLVSAGEPVQLAFRDDGHLVLRSEGIAYDCTAREVITP